MANLTKKASSALSMVILCLCLLTAKDRSDHSNHHITSPLPTHQLVHPVIEHNPTALIANPEAEPHLHNLMPMQPYSPLHIPQFTGAIQNLQFSPPPVAVNIPTVPTTAPANPTTATSPAPSTKIRGASDCPGVCILCGSTLRQARNLRRHLLSSCKYRFSANQNQNMMSGSMPVEVKHNDGDIPGYPSHSVVCGSADSSRSSSCEQIVCNPSPLPSPSPQGSNVMSPHSNIPSPTLPR